MDRQSFPRNTLIKPVTRTVLFQGDKEVASVDENPCWQDFYDEDCSMDSTFEAGFVPSEWLKKMPCASGLEVSYVMAVIPYVRPSGICSSRISSRF